MQPGIEPAVTRLRDAGHAPRIVHSGSDAIDSIAARRPDVIVANETLLENGNGASLLGQARRLAPEAEAILLQPDATESPAGTHGETSGIHVFRRLSIHAGVAELPKIIAEAADQAMRNRQQRVLREQADRKHEFEGILTANPQMERIISTIKHRGEPPKAQHLSRPAQMGLQNLPQIHT